MSSRFAYQPKKYARQISKMVVSPSRPANQCQKDFLLTKEQLKSISSRASIMPIINHVTASPEIIVPPASSLAGQIQAVYDQGNVGSCTANAFCQAFNILNVKNQTFSPSRLYIYARERQAEGARYHLSDSGGFEQDALAWARTFGICSEQSWPYIESRVNLIPPTTCDKDAVNHRILDVIEIASNDPATLLGKIKYALGIQKIPIMTAVGIYASFMSDSVAASGIVPLPTCQNYGDEYDPVDPFQGGHEVLAVGYDDSTQKVLFVNSWGANWGCKPASANTRGYFWLDYAYLTNPQLAMSFYTFDKILFINQ